jgi:hypothetical protein
MRHLSVLAIALFLSLSSASLALTLQDLDQGASFASTGGELTFDFAPGSIALAGALPADLSQYTVLPTASGFIVNGPLAVLGPAAFGGVTLAYRVSALSGLALSGATARASGIAFGPGALAIASSGFSNGAGLGILLVAGGGTGAASNAAFTAIGVLDALASLQLFGMTPGDVAAFGSVQHGFSWTALPEPAPMALLSAGLIGLAVLGSRRTRGPRTA